MKAPRNLGLAAGLVFAISYFLPAYGDGSGLACFAECWNTLLGHNVDIPSSGWFYYSGFVACNILFIGLVAALVATKQHRRVRLMVSIVCFLQVLSWWLLHFCQQPSQVAEIKIGYYLWLIAYAVLVAANLCPEPAGSLESIPLAGSAA
jgi:hypothetical protein